MVKDGKQRYEDKFICADIENCNTADNILSQIVLFTIF